MIVGFTGTRHGMTRIQRDVVELLLGTWRVMALEHGDCVGADEEADRIAVDFGIPRVLRPCNIEPLRAHCERRGGTVLKVYDPLPPLYRNEEIVRSSHRLLAAPQGPEELRSGTWSTIRRARFWNVETKTVFPDGRIAEESYR